MRWWQVSGSVEPTNTRARMRTPVEVKWHNMAKFDHDFIGCEALATEIANPKRTTGLTLCWNADDVLDTYASLVRPGEPYKQVELPYAPQRWPMAHADHVHKDGHEIGVSSGTIYRLTSGNFFRLDASTSGWPGSGTKSSCNGAITADQSRTFGRPLRVSRISPTDATATSMPPQTCLDRPIQ